MNAKRALGFERLESKSTPSSLMLLLTPDTAAPADEAAATTEVRASSTVDESNTNWHHEHSTADLLRFISANTTPADQTPSAELPSDDECRTADEMMKLDDDELQGLVFTAVFGTFDASSDS